MAQYPPDFNSGSPQNFGSQTAVPAPRSRTPLILGIVAGIAAVAMLFCCGGGFLVMRFGLDVMAVEVQDDLAARPEMQEHIGEIESLTFNMVRSGAHHDDETFVYDVVGSKGKGFVTVKQQTADDGSEVIVSAELTLSDGRKIPIDTTR